MVNSHTMSQHQVKKSTKKCKTAKCKKQIRKMQRSTAPQHLVCRVVQSLHTNHVQMSIVEVFVCRRLHMNTSMISVCIWLVCRLCTALHTKCCGAVESNYKHSLTTALLDLSFTFVLVFRFRLKFAHLSFMASTNRLLLILCCDCTKPVGNKDYINERSAYN